MNYFSVFSIAWGTIMIVLRLFMHLIPEAWNKFELNQIYSKKKPTWVWLLGLFSFFIVTFTWYKELTTNVPYSILLSILITITLIKVFQLMFNYYQFRDFVKKVLIDDRRILKKINLVTTIVGIILIFLGVFIY